MNITELARKLKLPTNELKEILPQVGFDIGQRAIKVDDRVAQQIIKNWGFLYKKYQAQKRMAKAEAEEKERAVEAGPKIVRIPEIITVRELAARLKLPVTRVIEQLMKSGIFASLNERIDYETAHILADDLGYQVVKEEGQEISVKPAAEEKLKIAFEAEKKENLKSRPPVVVVMGHVDHGKTKLLDAIRKTNVVAGEAGGITQHIGAYQAEKKDRRITFIDTPGHEAFTAMRSRGARVADIAILVVAADDSVKPQTVEALKIIEAAKLPLLVAINKIDKPEANVDKVKQDLAKYNLIPEDWGGKTVMAPVSALQGKGIDELLEMVLLVADLDQEKIRANPDRLALGTIIESHVDKLEGPVATVLVQAGTLKVNDILSIDNIFYGKVKAMRDWNGQIVKAAVPAMPVKILGFKVAPKVGDIVEVVAGMERLGKKVKKRDLMKQAISPMAPAVTKEEKGAEAKRVINLVIKTDVLGSLEAITESLEKIEHPEVGVKIVAKGLGNITETDVSRAESAKALVVGFNVMVSARMQDLAREKGVEVKIYKIIYEVINDVKGRLQEMLSPEVIRTDLGKAEVLAVFRRESDYGVIGGRVTSGKIEKGAKVSVLREEVEMTKGVIEELQHNKQPVKEVVQGQEFGMKFKGRPTISEGDILVIYYQEEKKRKL